MAWWLDMGPWAHGTDGAVYVKCEVWYCGEATERSLLGKTDIPVGYGGLLRLK
jgi:hypothetical protein